MILGGLVVQFNVSKLIWWYECNHFPTVIGFSYSNLCRQSFHVRAVELCRSTCSKSDDFIDFFLVDGNTKNQVRRAVYILFQFVQAAKYILRNELATILPY